MQCANPSCGCEAPYLRDGSLHLLELEASANPRLEGAERGFPMHSSPQKYFWLCGECTKMFSITKWTPSGVVLTPRMQQTSTIDQVSPQMADLPSAARGRSRLSFQFARWKSPQQQRA
jgi:hypothetical protein